ncbi:MAG TPA: sialate O-acetylesterase [bacterium]|nr:sialate O-acetylesterase [bacterium]
MLSRRLALFSTLLTLLILAAVPARAEVRLPSVFGDHMVIQRDLAAPIWGWADPGETVTVTIGGKKKSAAAGPNGRWQVKLDPMAAGGPHEITVAGSKNSITIKDVLVGEVWVCSGQSNMGVRVRSSINSDTEIANANYPRMRLFQIKQDFSAEPKTDLPASWQVCSPETVSGFSGVGYFFGRDLHRELDVPVGLIYGCWSGAWAEAWLSRDGLANPTVKGVIENWWGKISDSYPGQLKKYNEDLAKWEETVKQAREKGETPPRKPAPPFDPANSYLTPGFLYNAMIAPVAGYSIRGTIWYQGEGNIRWGYRYRKIFAALIRDWRRQWGQGDFPFLFVQIAGWRDVPKEPVESSFSELREAQLYTWQTVPNTGMAVTLDIGGGVVHFRNKQEVGRRLALAALANTYGRKNLAYSGPVYRSARREGDKLRLEFDHLGGGLVTSDGGPVQSLAIAGEDKKFVWAESKIEKDTLVVWSPKVTEPVAVRYGWGENPPINLFNKAGLPASPFRTDTWPMNNQREEEAYEKKVAEAAAAPAAK